MKIIRLQIPPEVEGIVRDVDVDYDNDLLATSGAAIPGLDMVSACVIESDLRARLPLLAEGLRSWAMENAATRHIELTVTSDAVQQVIDLTENVGAQEISQAMSIVFTSEEAW